MADRTIGSKRTKRHPASCRHKHELCLRIPSRLRAIEPVCQQIHTLLEECHLLQRWFAVEIATREGLNNAITHGNRMDGSSAVDMVMRVGRKLIRLEITDQGPGFNWRKLRRQGWPDPASTNGRGLMLMNAYAQRMVFNRRGNQVTLWINRSSEER